MGNDGARCIQQQHSALTRTHWAPSLARALRSRISKNREPHNPSRSPQRRVSLQVRVDHGLHTAGLFRLPWGLRRIGTGSAKWGWFRWRLARSKSQTVGVPGPLTASATRPTPPLCFLVHVDWGGSPPRSRLGRDVGLSDRASRFRGLALWAPPVSVPGRGALWCLPVCVD